jgi:hypothetical protein
MRTTYFSFWKLSMKQGWLSPPAVLAVLITRAHPRQYFWPWDSILSVPKARCGLPLGGSALNPK